MKFRYFVILLLVIGLLASMLISCQDIDEAHAEFTIRGSRMIDNHTTITLDATESDAHTYKWRINSRKYYDCPDEYAICNMFISEGKGVHKVELHVYKNVRQGVETIRTDDKTHEYVFVDMPFGAGSQGKLDDRSTSTCRKGAKVQLTARPGTLINQGDTLELEAHNTSYDVIRWDIQKPGDLEFSPIGACNHATRCYYTFNDTGIYTVKVKVKTDSYEIVPIFYSCGQTKAFSIAEIAVYPNE